MQTCPTIDRRLAVEYLPIENLTPDPENARRHKPAQIRQIAKSIQAFDFNVPILIDADGKVIAGHGRFLACKHLGHQVVPVIRLEHLTREQVRAFAIADNRLTETSTWDEALLSQHLQALSELDLSFDLEATGFSVGEIDLKIQGLNVDDAATDDGDNLPAPGPPVAQAGDMWRLGSHRILCGSALDATSYSALLGADRVAMVFTDPPYNVRIDGHVSGKGGVKHREFAMASGEMTEPEFVAFLTRACKLMADVTVDGGINYVCMDWGHCYALIAAGRAVYSDLLNICVWAKPNGGMGGLYRSAHELVLVFKAGRGAHRNNVQLGRFGRNRTNVWNYAGANGLQKSEDSDLTRHHPTPKPVALVADAILDVTSRRDLVLDPFLGSGSTLIAAERVGRRCMGLELDPLYVDLTIRRWQRLTGQKARLDSGKSFDELEATKAEVAR